MSRIRGKGNKSTEIKLLKLFRKHGIKGWRRHQPLTGKPDFVFSKEGLAIFVNGVCAELGKWKPQKPKDPKHIWFIPNHDAIWIQKSAEYAVKRVMTKHWSKHIGEIPKWDTTLFAPEA